MDIELRIKNSYYLYQTYYHDETVLAWQNIWNKLFRMSYFREDIVDEIITMPTRSDDLEYYKKSNPNNYYEITLAYCWREFCKTHKDYVQVVPELKKIYVPECLFACPGVWSWFNYSFPNCKITFWC